MDEPDARPWPRVRVAAAAQQQTAQSYPFSNMGGAIRLEKMIPEHVNINAPFEYRINVTNLTDQELSNVVVSGLCISRPYVPEFNARNAKNERRLCCMEYRQT